MSDTKNRPAAGTVGHLIYRHGADLSDKGEYFFRVYDQDHNFTDYEIYQEELKVQIVDDGAMLEHRLSENRLTDNWSPPV